MRKIVSIIILFIAIGSTVSMAQVQSLTFSEYLQEIESRNPALIALKKQYEAKIVGNRVGLAPSDPEVEFEPMFNGELDIKITQSLAFPTLYFKMSKLAKFATKRNEMEYYAGIYDVLRQVSMLGVDAIYYNKKLALLDEVCKNAEEIEAFTSRRFEAGDINIIEKNRAKAMLVDVLALRNSARSEYASLQKKIFAMNDSKEIKITDKDYPMFRIGETETYVERAITESYAIKISNMDSIMAKQQIKISKDSWLPNLNLGYKHAYNAAGATRYNMDGVIVGMSIPLWQNTNKVKQSRLQYEATKAEMKSVRLNTEAFLNELVNGYNNSVMNMEKYSEYLKTGNNTDAIIKALQAGEISVLEFFVEHSAIITTRLALLEYERSAYNTAAQMKSFLY